MNIHRSSHFKQTVKASEFHESEPVNIKDENDTDNINDHNLHGLNEIKTEKCEEGPAVKTERLHGDLEENQKTSKKIKSVRSFTCESCSKKFTSSSHLYRHERTHSRHGNNKPFGCYLCGSHFTSASDLSQHMKKHTNERLYVCEYKGCEKTFKHSCHRNEHQRWHIEGKMYSCMKCGQDFYKKSDLIRHCRSHAGLRTFVCEYCKKGFLRSCHLTRHQKNKVCRKEDKKL